MITIEGVLMGFIGLFLFALWEATTNLTIDRWQRIREVVSAALVGLVLGLTAGNLTHDAHPRTQGHLQDPAPLSLPPARER